MKIVQFEKSFLKQIKDNLNGMSHKQITFFSWLCAARVFPFLGNSEVVTIWSKKLTNYLYTLLYSMDTVYATIHSLRVVTATDVANAAIIADDVDITCGDDIRFAVKAISYTVHVAYIANLNTTNTETIIDVATDVAINIQAAAEYHKVDFSDIIVNDIWSIKKGDYSSFLHSTAVYGSIWHDFQNALHKCECEYWAKLFSDIFNSGFSLSIDELERRINIPTEIQEQGVRVVGLYLENLEIQGSQCLNEARIIILGEKGAGKTCLARRLSNIEAPMTEKEESTEGVVTTIWKINDNPNNHNVNVHIWDFAGHVITHAAHRCFLSERCVYIIVYDGRTEERNRLSYWLDHVRNYGGGAPVRVLVNIFDEHKPDIPENTLKEKYPYIKDFVYLSLEKDIDKLKKFRMETSEFIQSNPMWDCLEIPATYFKVKEILEKRFQKDSQNFYNEHISKEVFYQIIEMNGIEIRNTDQLLIDLHELGICLWYSDIEEFNMLVLNPDWISYGIYSIINWAHNNSLHTISLDDYENIFSNEKARYPKDKLSFIFRLMKKYELAYSKETDDVITIPFLLREDQPNNLPFFPVEDSLLIQYVAEQTLPPDTISRFIVRHNVDIKNSNEVWRHGVVLRYKQDTVASVKEDDRKIIIKARGSYKSEYIANLRSTMNDIFSSYKGAKPELQYKIIMNETTTIPHENDDSKPFMLSDETIRSYISNGRSDYYYPKSNIDIPLDRVANIYNINTTNATFGSNSQIVSNIFNFPNCNLVLQGEIRSLISSLSSKGYAEEADNLETALSELEAAENIDTKKDVIKSGSLNKLKNFLEDIGNEESAMCKAINGVKYGVKTAQSIAKTYNDIAQWVGLPQVPKPFLGGV